MKKKLSIICLSLVAFLALSYIFKPQAKEGVIDSNGFRISQGYLLTEYIGDEENIIIPENVTKINDRAFRGCKKIKSIVIPGTVKEIGIGAFWGCKNLEEVTLEEGIEILRGWIFQDCLKLNEIVIPKSLKRANKAFRNSNVKKVIFADGTKRILDGILFEANDLITVVLPNSITSIGMNAFNGCNNLTNINISENITEIGDYAFNKCKSLKNFDLPKNLKKLGVKVFAKARNLKEITIPKSLQEYSESFKSSQIEKVIFENGTIKIPKKILQNTDNLKNIVIPNTAKIIEDGAFLGCNKLEIVTIPDSVEIIGFQAFNLCENLRRVELSNSVKEIDSQAFEKNQKLLIVCPKNSYAAQYAKKRDIHYFEVE